VERDTGPKLRLYLFGAPRIEREGAPVEVGRRKALALLAYLAATRQSHTRETLAALLWPEYEPASARGEVRRALSALRKALGDGWLDADREIVRLNDGLWLDVAQFQRLLKACQQHGHPPTEVCLACRDPLTEAAALAQDEFMAGFTLPDSPAFDDWQSYEREGLRRDLAGALERLAGLLGRSAEESTGQAIGYARRWLALDPLDEAAHRLLMQLYARSGQRQAALQQYQECVQLLESELGLPPADETTALVERIRSGEFEQTREPDTAPPPPISASPPHNLPASLTPFVAREEELEEIEALLAEPDCRLLTLTGVGGLGKTRLGTEVARRALAVAERHFPDGIYFVDLAPVSSTAFLVSAIATTLGLTIQGSSDPKLQLLDSLRDKAMLLVLDNCEHLLDGADLFAEMLQSAPDLKLLATSRERLNLRAETVYPLEGLPVPADEGVERVEAYGAVELFAQSARRVDRHFALASAETREVIRVCQLVQGLPLGIELAAAWVRTLSCAEIASEIEHDLDFLSLSMRDMPERHRSLRAVFEHSWRLLSEEERRVLRRLTVFQGGFRREEAERVAGASLRVLLSLRDKSLLRREPSGRYGMHELVRQHAADKLRLDPEEERQVRNLHYRTFATFVQQRERDLLGSRQMEAIAEISSELENVRQGWQWSIEQRDIVAASTLTEMLYRLYTMRNWYYEGEATFRGAVRALEAAPADEARNGLLGKVLAKQAYFCQTLDFYEESRTLTQTALSVLRSTGQSDTADVGFCFHTLGGIAWLTGDFREAQQQWQQSLRIRRELGDRLGVCISVHNLGAVADDLGELEEAIRFYRESLAIRDEFGDRLGSGTTLNNIGHLLIRTGDYAEAERLLHENLTILEELGNHRGDAHPLFNLGWVGYKQGDHTKAREYFEASLAVIQKLGNSAHAAFPLSDLGRVARALGDYDAARRYHREALEGAWGQEMMPALFHVLVGIAEWLHETGAEEEAVELCAFALHFPATKDWDRQLAKEELTRLAAKLSTQCFEAAYERGKSRELAEVVTETLLALGEG
jgi:predicted ATPase/DNA-binding SARP family transcriptional activator/Tfp pilus assembly protein PilF